ncbi:SA1362 family protein [Fredinandcohnia humi]
MNRRKSNIVIMILLGLGAFGFLYTLFTHPGSLLMQAGMIFLFIGIIYLLYKFVFVRRMGSKEYSAYLRAAKQSKRRFTSQSQKKTQFSGTGIKKTSTTPTKKSTVSSINKKKKNTHLTVIEGKKGKKKNRALF